MKLSLIFALVLTSLFVCSFANAAVRFDPDVGKGKSVVKIEKFNSGTPVQIQLVACHEAPLALVRLEYVEISYMEPKSEGHIIAWNARIHFNYCFQLPRCRIRADDNNSNTLLA